VVLVFRSPDGKLLHAPCAERRRHRVEDDEDEEEGPLTITKVNTFLAILYFIIPGLVIGLPVFLLLAVLNLAFLVVAAAVITAAETTTITPAAVTATTERDVL
jgi:uncharacterized membrane protein